MTIGQLKEVIEMVGDESVEVWFNNFEIYSADIKIGTKDHGTNPKVLHLTLSEED